MSSMMRQGQFGTCTAVALAAAIQKNLSYKYGEDFSDHDIKTMLLALFDCWEGKNLEDLCEEFNRKSSSIWLQNSGHRIRLVLDFNRIDDIEAAVKIYKDDDRVMIVAIEMQNGESHAVVVDRAFDDSESELYGRTYWGPPEPSLLLIDRTNFTFAISLETVIVKKMDGSGNQLISDITRGYRKVSKDDNRNTLLNLILCTLKTCCVVVW